MRGLGVLDAPLEAGHDDRGTHLRTSRRELSYLIPHAGRRKNRRVHSRTTVLSPLAHVNVDVEIYFADAGLLRAVRAAFMPAAGMGAGISDMSQSKTAPLRKPAAALAGELPRQHDLFAASVGPDDMWTQLTMPAVVAAGDLLLPADRIAEESVGCARHRQARLRVVVQLVTFSNGNSNGNIEAAPFQGAGLDPSRPADTAGLPLDDCSCYVLKIKRLWDQRVSTGGGA